MDLNSAITIVTLSLVFGPTENLIIILKIVREIAKIIG